MRSALSRPSVLALALHGFLGILALAAPSAAQTPAPGFSLEEIATVPNLSSIALAPPGSAYGVDLYVAADGGMGLADVVVRVDASGVVSPFGSLLPEADPTALEFPPPGSPFGDVLYVAANNHDHGQSGDCGGEIQAVDTAGNWADLTSMKIGALCNCNGGALGGDGLGEPEGMSFGPGGAYGDDLFVTNATDAPADVMRVDPGGATSIFVDDGQFSCLGTAGFRSWSVHFDQGGAFGGAMFFADANAGVWSVDAGGTVTGLFLTLPETVKCVRFSPGGEFGTDLYVGTSTTIYRVAPDASHSVVATDFLGIANDGLEFSADGNELYVAEGSSGTVHRLTTCTSASAHVRVPCSGAHPSGSLAASNAPVLGTTFEVLIDDPLDQAGLAAGTTTGWALAWEPSLGYPCGVPAAGLGIGAAAGELLIFLGAAGPQAQVHLGVGTAWGGPGVAAAYGVPIPNAAELCGVALYAQGFFFDGADIVLTEGLDLVVGS